ncbi:hypothetical protein MSAS_03400 [Mycobacterium saskatchewanense]|uniref:HTH tetR-type domain-containing protein n=1 Tax=Mycobacterium saskatchewanense TaxID=220927 RepID=A0AAJ3NVG8_9MYCO|nr:TetR family transcriptional regulator [Mycobacterium saskatchewanense]ORW75173.1 hypothetical protein AWC23_03070 [Mycobacterium saskatchewanense]BBX61166.1 hypothetical protein MSAS_03400 [Mycobacterium saskatchewanense]
MVDRGDSTPADERNPDWPEEPTAASTPPGTRTADAARDSVLAAGREIFATIGYSDATDLQICKRARATRGALQHHFGSKFGLFVAVVEHLQRDLCTRMSEAINLQHDPLGQARAGIATFLDGCGQATYHSVVLEQGPAVLGWDGWRELDDKYYAPPISALTDMLLPPRHGGYTAAMGAVAIRGAMTALTFEIARARDTALARTEALAVVDHLLISLQGMPSSADPAPARIGIGQLRATTSAYLDRVEAGEIFDVLRRGRVVARIQRCPPRIDPQ